MEINHYLVDSVTTNDRGTVVTTKKIHGYEYEIFIPSNRNFYDCTIDRCGPCWGNITPSLESALEQDNLSIFVTMVILFIQRVF